MAMPPQFKKGKGATKKKAPAKKGAKKAPAKKKGNPFGKGY